MSEAAPPPPAGTLGSPGSPGSKPYVFLGPSLPLGEAQRILDAVYLPPVSMGDIYRLMERRPRVIAIIDGLFEQTPAVWHKEILYALSQGVRVLGASSMGALRAAELAAFGMEGVGQVFEAFHRGELEDDDEVAVAHAPAADGFRSVSDAMVNLREGLRQAREAGRISGATHDRLLGAGKSLYYPDRSWPRLFAAAGGLGIPEQELQALRDQIARGRPDVKRSDAVELLQRLAAEQAGPPASPVAPAPASFDFEPTYFWDQMILHESSAAAPDTTDQAPQADGARDHVTSAALQRHLRVDQARAREALDTALLLFLADEQAMRRGLDGPVAPGSEDRPAPAPRSREHLSSRSLAHLERGERAIDGLLAALPDQINQRLPAALARLGRLEPTLIDVRRKQAILHSLGLRAAAPLDAGIAMEDLFAWYQRRFGPLDGTPDERAQALGFASVEEFTSEVVLEYLLERGREP
jgi:hypothetical protein